MASINHSGGKRLLSYINGRGNQVVYRESITQRCPQCGASTRVLADEVGDHPCGRCGYDPEIGRKINEELTKYEGESLKQTAHRTLA